MDRQRVEGEAGIRRHVASCHRCTSTLTECRVLLRLLDDQGQSLLTTCPDSEQLLSFVEAPESLSLQDRAVLSGHLALCRDCAELVEVCRRVSSSSDLEETLFPLVLQAHNELFSETVTPPEWVLGRPVETAFSGLRHGPVADLGEILRFQTRPGVEYWIRLQEQTKSHSRFVLFGKALSESAGLKARKTLLSHTGSGEVVGAVPDRFGNFSCPALAPGLASLFFLAPQAIDEIHLEIA
jgi:hypothetical protein